MDVGVFYNNSVELKLIRENYVTHGCNAKQAGILRSPRDAKKGKKNCKLAVHLPDERSF